MQISHWRMMKLIPIPATHIDSAWSDGADCLALACEQSGGEIKGDQLKMILSRGERHLLRMERDGKTVGWGAVRIDQLPNIRVLFVTDMVAPNGHFEEFFTELKTMAKNAGCSRIRCAAKPAQERLYRMQCGFASVYSIMEVLV